jgi:hypothetical protein
MLQNTIVLVVMTAIAAVVTASIGLGWRKGRSSFDGWWNAEGVPIFILLWFVFAAALVARGCLRDTS